PWNGDNVAYLLALYLCARVLDERERGRDIGREGSGRMPRAGLSAGSSKVDVAIDLGNPLLNRTVDGFLKIGARSAPAGWPPRTPSTALNCPESCHYLEHTGKNVQGGRILG
uniref:Uncharacterized protein n=1 Tax=Aegilops tauschii subsp. strangulata TaxID=200361 RepID=A0A452XN26_AEGTS